MDELKGMLLIVVGLMLVLLAALVVRGIIGEVEAVDYDIRLVLGAQVSLQDEATVVLDTKEGQMRIETSDITLSCKQPAEVPEMLVRGVNGSGVFVNPVLFLHPNHPLCTSATPAP